MFKNVKRFAMAGAVGVMMIVASYMSTGRGVLLASPGACYCSGDVFAFTGGDDIFVGSATGLYSYQGVSPNNVDCAGTRCQNWINSQGKALCDQYNLYGGGWVIMDWTWRYYGDPQDSGDLVQAASCDGFID